MSEPKTAEEWLAKLERVSTNGHDCGSFYSPGKIYRIIDTTGIQQIMDSSHNAAIDEAVEVLNKTKWGYDGDCGAEQAILTLKRTPKEKG